MQSRAPVVTVSVPEQNMPIYNNITNQWSPPPAPPNWSPEQVEAWSNQMSKKQSFGEAVLQKAGSIDFHDAASSVTLTVKKTKYDTSMAFYSLLVATLAYLTVGVVAIVTYFTSSLNSSYVFQTYATGSDGNGIVAYKSGWVSPVVMVSVASLLWFIGGTIGLVLWNMASKPLLDARSLYINWVTESLAFPVLFSAVVAALLQVNLQIIVFAFALAHVSVIFTIVQEFTFNGGWLSMMNDDSGKPRMARVGSMATYWNALYGLWVVFLLYVPVVVSIAYTSNIGQTQAAFWVAFGFILARSVLAYLVQMGFARFLRDPTTGWALLYNSTKSEKINNSRYASFSYLFTAALNVIIAVMIIVAAYGDHTYTDGANASPPAANKTQALSLGLTIYDQNFTIGRYDYPFYRMQNFTVGDSNVFKLLAFDAIRKTAIVFGPFIPILK